MHRGLGSGVSGNLEEEGVSCCSESETRARFRVGKPNLGERRGGVGGLAVVRRWTAICWNEIGEYTRMIPKKLHTIQVKIRANENQNFSRFYHQRVQIEAVHPLFIHHKSANVEMTSTSAFNKLSLLGCTLIPYFMIHSVNSFGTKFRIFNESAKIIAHNLLKRAHQEDVKLLKFISIHSIQN